MMEEEQGQDQGQEQQHSATVPPGCRFHPSEEILLRYYLTNKNNGNGDFYGSDLIRELDLYGYDPFELPDGSCFEYGYGGRKRHWYCYTTVRVSRDTWQRRRKVKSGFWIKKGRVKNVFGVGGGSVVLGTRNRFVFYVGNSRRSAIRTDWVLYEYALVDHLVDSFVLCRVFVKPRYKNNISEIGLSSCAEETISAVRHIGIQHDEDVRPDVAEHDAKVCNDSCIDRNNEISVHPLRCANVRDEHQAMNAHVSDATIQHSVGPQGNQLLSIAHFYGSNNLKSLVRNGAISIGSSLAFYLLCDYLFNFSFYFQLQKIYVMVLS